MSEQDLERIGEGLEQTSTEQSDSTTQESTARQSINWQEDPEYKRIQSKTQKELAAAQRAAWEASQRAAQLEQQIQALQLRGLEGEELLAAQNQLLQRQLAEVQRQRDLDAWAIQRQRDLQDIVAETGVPLEEIENMPNVHEAWRYAKKWERENATKSSARPTRQEVIEREADDRVDLGAGRPTPKSKAIQDKYDLARKNYDIKGQLEAMAEADMKGVKLNEW